MRKLLTFLKTLTAALAVIVLFTACKQLLDDPEDFLSYWASEVFVKGHSIGSAHRPDKAGVPCVGSSDNVLITLTAHNPKGFSLVMPTSSEPAGIVEFKELSYQPAAGADYELKQTGSGTLELTYKQDFLKRYEQGSAALNPTITLKAKDGRVFKKTYTFGIKSNTPPPKPKEIVLAKTKGSDSRYVLCLQFDSAEMTKKVTIGSGTVPIHKDIAKITINDSPYTLLYKEDNSDFQKPAGDSFVEHGNVEKLTSSSPNLPSGAWVLYFNTGVKVESSNEQTSYTITLSDNKGVVSDSLTAELKEKFKVKFNAKSGTPEPDTQYIENGGKVTRPTDPAQAGYTFGGWYKNADCSDGQEWNFATDTVTGNMTLYAKWTAGSGIGYEVEHHQQKIADGSYEWYETDVQYGTTGATIVAETIKKNYEGFEYDHMNTTSPTITGDGNTVVKLYYNRKTYQVDFSVDGSGGSISATAVTGGTVSESPVTVKYDGSVTFTATPNTGYAVDSWSSNVNVDASDNKKATLSNVKEITDKTVTVEFEKVTAIAGTDNFAWKLLKKAVEIADPNAVITINGEIKASGPYEGDCGEIVINGKSLTIKKADGAASAVLDASRLSRIFKVENGANLILENLKLTGGKADGTEDADKCGGAIYAKNASEIKIENCTITDNEAYTNGGGLNVEGTPTTITNCTFTGNTAKNGGGIYIIGASSYLVVTIKGSTIGGTDTDKANKATGTGSDGNGGGIYVGDRCKVILKNNDSTGCTIKGNTAQLGGGVYANNADVSMNGGTQIAVDNDVYLHSNSWIKVADTLTAEAPVARITVPNNQYLPSTKVLDGNAALLSSEHGKFAVTPNNSEHWTVDSNGYLTKGKTAVFNNITKNQIEAAIAAASSMIYGEGATIDHTELDDKLVLYMTKRNGHFNYGIMHVTNVNNSGGGYIKFNYKTFRAYDSDVLHENDKVVNGGTKFDLDTGNVNVNGSDFSLENTGQKRFKVLDYAKFYILSN